MPCGVDRRSIWIKERMQLLTWQIPATAKRARTIFSPSPTHLLISELALMLKNVA